MAEIKADVGTAGSVTPPGGSAAPVETHSDAPNADAYDFQKTYEALDPRFRDEYNQRVWNFTNGQLEQQFGDVLPAFIEIANDPDLRKAFAQLTDKERREFVLRNGNKVWDETHTATREPAVLTQEDLDRKLKERDDAAAMKAQETQYMNARIADKEALISEFPDLKWKDASDPNYRYVANLIETAHALSATRGRFVSCKEVIEEQKRSVAPPPAAPATSRSDVGVERPQAPTSAAEGTVNMVKRLAKMGGITRGAQTLQRR